ncbi:MAG TPA: pyridoxal 5'-phosphate synthase glutaminase subunit PdxT [Vicinamibacteria bacterium]|jgi:5'-phosphate synthase pdxT subunit
MKRDLTVGILALQGDYSEHRRALAGLDIDPRLVKHADDLEGLAGLILPGGESTTMLKFMLGESLMEPIRRFHENGGALFGTCAGAILLAKETSSPKQESLGLLDLSVERNGYGRQLESHIAHESCPALGETPVEMVFIRAPVVRRVGPDVEVLAYHHQDPVFVRQGRLVATTFHPELSNDSRVHSFFVHHVMRSENAFSRL